MWAIHTTCKWTLHKINAIVCGSRCVFCTLNNSDLSCIGLCSTVTTTMSKSAQIHLIGQHSKNHYRRDDLLSIAMYFWVKFTVKTEFDNLADERAGVSDEYAWIFAKVRSAAHFTCVVCKCRKCENVKMWRVYVYIKFVPCTCLSDNPIYIYFIFHAHS